MLGLQAANDLACEGNRDLRAESEQFIKMLLVELTKTVLCNAMTVAVRGSLV